MTSPAPDQQRLDGIDVLRGLSILAVILLHISLRLRFAGHSLEPSMPSWLHHLLFWNGNNGVQVFFAVSGFLITTMSIRRFGSLASIDLARFYRIRFARIAPLLLLLLAVLSVLHLVGSAGYRIDPARVTLPRALAAALGFHLNLLEAQRGYLPASWDILWSLSVEEMFYLFYPPLCLLLARRTWLFTAALLVFVAMGPFARTAWAWNEIWAEKSYLGGMDAIAMGCLTVLLVRGIALPPRGWVLTAIQAAGAALMLTVAVWPRWGWLRAAGRAGLDGSILALGACLVMAASVWRGRAHGAWSGPARWLGRHSYEVYLTHEFVVIHGTILYLRTGGPAAAWIAGLTLASAALGAVVARWFSEPLNRKLRGPATPSVSP